MTQTTPVYLVRHCDVQNPNNVIYGHLPNFPLSEKGVAQAHALGRRFAGQPLHHIYTSPLERAQQTASIIASYLPDATVTVTEDLTEALFTKYTQGIKKPLVPLLRPLWFFHLITPGLLRRDERVATMAARVRRTILRLLSDSPTEGGICVTHGDPIQAFWIEATGRHPYALHRLECAKGGHLELTFTGDTLASLNYVGPIETTSDVS